MLIIAALAGIIFWETIGREAIIYKEIIVAASDIQEGSIITNNMISTKAFQKDNTISNAITKDKINSILGKKAKHNISQNAQITEDFFYCNEFYLKENESIYVIKPEWIYSMSASIRRGDRVSIYTFEELEKIGTYQVAFVKDNNDREVKTVESNSDALLERTDGSSMIHYIEIICDITEYQKILDKTKEESKILIIPEEGGNTNDKN